MKFKFAREGILFQRWSYAVPLLCYVMLFCMIWMLSVPLKPHMKIQPPAGRKQMDVTFDVKIRNSNFDSDKKEDELLNSRNEFLISVDDQGKGQGQILVEVFRKWVNDHYSLRLNNVGNFRADSNKDGRLDSKELAEWIRHKIVEHISAAVSNNYGLFSLIDVNPRNGVITWKEYHSYFLKERGFSNNYVENHDEKRHKGLQRSIKGM